MEALRPCPFCGYKDVTLEITDDKFGLCDYTCIHCKGCELSIVHFECDATDEDFIAKWNLRVTTIQTTESAGSGS